MMITLHDLKHQQIFLEDLNKSSFALKHFSSKRKFVLVRIECVRVCENGNGCVCLGEKEIERGKEKRWEVPLRPNYQSNKD